jgi:hypothetical protein
VSKDSSILIPAEASWVRYALTGHSDGLLVRSNSVRGGGVTLYYNHTPCAFSLKIIDSLLRTACTESHPLLRTDTKYTHPYCRARYPFCRHTKMFKDRRVQLLLACTGSWRGVQPGQGPGVKPGGPYTLELRIQPLYQQFSEK